MALGAWSLLLGTALWFAPQALVARMRSVMLDALKPGLMLAKQGRASCSDWIAQLRAAQLRELQTQLAAARETAEKADERLQRLTAQLVLQSDQTINGPTASSEQPQISALFQPALLDARVIGETLSSSWRSGVVLERGWKDGVRESALVLKSRRPLIDLGQPDQLSAEDPLLVGSTVVGKVEIVGRWTSTFLPVTDPDYRGAVQLVRESETGPVWGAKGILRGDGKACLLEGIPLDAAVRVGDAVYSAGRDGVLEAPLYYGTVAEAQLGPDDREWRIRVAPGATPSTMTHVRVLRAALNPHRLWTH